MDDHMKGQIPNLRAQIDAHRQAQAIARDAIEDVSSSMAHLAQLANGLALRVPYLIPHLSQLLELARTAGELFPPMLDAAAIRMALGVLDDPSVVPALFAEHLAELGQEIARCSPMRCPCRSSLKDPGRHLEACVRADTTREPGLTAEIATLVLEDVRAILVEHGAHKSITAAQVPGAVRGFMMILEDRGTGERREGSENTGKHPPRYITTPINIDDHGNPVDPARPHRFDNGGHDDDPCHACGDESDAALHKAYDEDDPHPFEDDTSGDDVCTHCGDGRDAPAHLEAEIDAAGIAFCEGVLEGMATDGLLEHVADDDDAPNAITSPELTIEDAQAYIAGVWTQISDEDGDAKAGCIAETSILEDARSDVRRGDDPGAVIAKLRGELARSKRLGDSFTDIEATLDPHLLARVLGTDDNGRSPDLSLTTRRMPGTELRDSDGKPFDTGEDAGGK